MKIAPGYCQCGCGQKTRLATQNDATTGRIVGQPMRFISGHNGRKSGIKYDAPPSPTRLCACGCGRRTKRASYTAGTVGIIKSQPLRFIHGHARRTHGMCNTPEMKAFLGARNRCHPENKDRRYYSDRGVQFLFKDFAEFYAELGAQPSAAHSIDRINPDGNYEPGNVRWATAKEQQGNRRDQAVRHIMRNSSLRGLYISSRWRKLAKQILRQNPVCVECQSAPSIDCDHRIPARVWIAQHNGDVERFFDADNLRGLCWPCHKAKVSADYRLLVDTLVLAI